MREVIDPDLGLLAPRGDLAGLTTLVEALLGDRARRTELGEACRVRVASRFSEDLVLERLVAVYDAALESA